MEVAIDSVQEVARSRDAAAGQPCTGDTGFGGPSLDHPHGQRSVDIRLEAASATAERKGEGIPGLFFGKAQDLGGRRRRPEGNAYAGGVETVVLGLAEVEADRQFVPHHDCRQEVRPTHSTGQLSRGKSRRYDGCTGVGTGDHGIFEVKSPRHHGVGESGLVGRDLAPVH